MNNVFSKQIPKFHDSPLEWKTAEGFLLKTPPQRDYLLKNLLPLGVVGLMVATGSTGKSMLSLQTAVSIASGLPVFDGLYEVAAPGHVVVIAGEEDEGELHRRLYAISRERLITKGYTHEKIKKVGRRIHVLPRMGLESAFIEDDIETSFFDGIVDAVSDIDSLSMIIIDPLRRFFSGDENDSYASTKIITALEQLAKATGATVLALHHVNKASKGNPLDAHAARGSSAFTDAVRFQMNLSRIDKASADRFGIPAEERHLFLELAITKNNYAPPQSDRVFLKRGEHGVLKYVPLDGSLIGGPDLIPQIVELIENEYKNGKTYAKTKFINHYKGKAGPFGVSEKLLRQAIDQAIEQGLLCLSKSSSSGKGKPAQQLIPKTTQTTN